VGKAVADQHRQEAPSGPLEQPLLGTKVMVPPTPAWLVARPRLLDLLTVLNRAAQHRLPGLDGRGQSPNTASGESSGAP
jgi:hypothetical protein